MTAQLMTGRHRVEDLTGEQMRALAGLYLALQETADGYYEIYCAAPVPGGYDTRPYGAMTEAAAHQAAWEHSRDGYGRPWRVEHVIPAGAAPVRTAAAEYRRGRRITAR